MDGHRIPLDLVSKYGMILLSDEGEMVRSWTHGLVWSEHEIEDEENHQLEHIFMSLKMKHHKHTKCLVGVARISLAV